MQACQKVLRHGQAVSGAGTQVADRTEILRDRRLRCGKRGKVERTAKQHALRLHGALRRGRHAAKGQARSAYHAIGDRQGKAGANGGDVLIVAPRDFPGAEMQAIRCLPCNAGGGHRACLAQWYAHCLHDLARGEAREATVGRVEVLQRQFTGGAGMPEQQPGTERDQCRHRITDRAAVGDVAAQRAGIADRARTEAAVKLFGFRVMPGQRPESVIE